MAGFEIVDTGLMLAPVQLCMLSLPCLPYGWVYAHAMAMQAPQSSLHKTVFHPQRFEGSNCCHLP